MPIVKAIKIAAAGGRLRAAADENKTPLPALENGWQRGKIVCCSKRQYFMWFG